MNFTSTQRVDKVHDIVKVTWSFIMGHNSTYKAEQMDHSKYTAKQSIKT